MRYFSRIVNSLNSEPPSLHPSFPTWRSVVSCPAGEQARAVGFCYNFSKSRRRSPKNGMGAGRHSTWSAGERAPVLITFKPPGRGQRHRRLPIVPGKTSFYIIVFFQHPNCDS